MLEEKEKLRLKSLDNISNFEKENNTNENHGISNNTNSISKNVKISSSIFHHLEIPHLNLNLKQSGTRNVIYEDSSNYTTEEAATTKSKTDRKTEYIKTSYTKKEDLNTKLKRKKSKSLILISKLSNEVNKNLIFFDSTHDLNKSFPSYLINKNQANNKSLESEVNYNLLEKTKYD